MPMIKPTQSLFPDGTGGTVTWAGFGEGEMCMAVFMPPRCSFQVEGQFEPGTKCFIEGSNDGINFRPLTDASGVPLVFTAVGIGAPIGPVNRIRPRVVSPNPVALTVTAMFVSS